VHTAVLLACLGVRSPVAPRDSPRSLLSSIRPSTELSGSEAIELQLLAMQGGDVDGGAELWMRFAHRRFALAAIEPWGAPALARAVRDPASQYALLTDRRLCVDFPSEAVERVTDAGLARVWHEVEMLLVPDGAIDGPFGMDGFTAAKLGWECEWDATRGWLTRRISWHDFRPAFRPGIGQEEWPRVCG